MKETGIIMSGDHPQKIIDEIKTMTRRIYGLEKINQDPDRWISATPIPKNRLLYSSYKSLWEFWDINNNTLVVKCPYGGINDLMWVKETYSIRTDGVDQILYKSDYHAVVKMLGLHEFNIKWKSSMFMFRKDSRIDLKNIDIRPERLQEITEEDACAEGANGYKIDKLIGGNDYRAFKEYHHEAFPLVSHADEGDIVRFSCPNMGYATFNTHNLKNNSGHLSIPQKEVWDYIGSTTLDYKNGFRILWDSINGKKYPWSGNWWLWGISFKVVK